MLGYLALVLPFIWPILPVIGFIILGRQLTMGVCHNKNSMANRTVLITGGNVGIGYETVIDMARRGAKVIVGCRRVEGLAERVRRDVPGAEVEVFHLDLSVKESVLEFCKQVKRNNTKIHVLINNSAIVSNPNNNDKYTREMSADGKHELTMATNYIGHCILNESLMGLVAAAGRELKFEPEGQNYARIIVVSSVVVFIFNDLHKLKNFDLDGSAAIKAGTFDTHKQYKASKHAQILYTRKLARKLEAEGVNAAVSANCPGLVNTKISDGMVSWIRRIFTTAGIFLGKDCRMGAQCTNYQATETMSMKKFNEGFFMDCRQFNWLMNWRAPESRLDEFWEQTQKAMAA